MKLAFLGSLRGCLAAFAFTTVLVTFASADQIEMQNGDRYTGKVLALETNAVVLKSEMLGTIRIRRDHVSSISLGNRAEPTASQAAVSRPPAVPTASTSLQPSPTVDLNSSVSHQIAGHSELVNEIRTQVLTGAGPKAAAKYDSLVEGLNKGTLNLNDVRREAATVAGQLRELRGAEDDGSAAIFDEYLAILDSFVAATEPGAAPGISPIAPQRTVSATKKTSSPADTRVNPGQRR